MTKLFAEGFLFVFTITLLSIPAGNSYAERFPVAGKDPLSVKIVELHSQAFLGWVKKGIKNSVLINFDAHDDMRWIDPQNVDALKKIKKDQDWQAFKEAGSIKKKGLYHIGSFIHAACQLGVISRVYWVIPFPYLQGAEPQKEMNAFLKKYGFPREDIDKFTFEDSRYKGIYYGTPVVICDMASLPVINDPVVLTIDADFFPSYSAMYKKDMLCSISKLFAQVREKGYRVKDATVSSSTDGGYLDISRRWIVEICKEFLKNPDKITEPYPEKWLVYNLADTYYYQDKADDLVSLIERFEKKYSQDIGINVYKSFSLLARKKEKEAFLLAKEITEKDDRYAYLLADLGQCLIDKGRLDLAVTFFKEAYHQKPDMNFRQKNLADAFFKNGQYQKAIYYYKVYGGKNGFYPVAFNIGLSYQKAENKKNAKKWFKKGFISLRNEKYADIACPVDINALRASVKYFKENKMRKEAEYIMEHSSLKSFFK
jgi:tetratricopeptide (TPR) repeat protein